MKNSKYFAYLYWRMADAENDYAIVSYEDMQLLIGVKGRYSKEDIERLFDSAKDTFSFGAIIKESSGHHQLVVANQEISLKFIMP